MSLQDSKEQAESINKHKSKFFWLKKKRKKSNFKARTIGQWTLGQTLGMGGYSKVKLGTNSTTKQTVALKIMFADGETGIISDSKKKQLRRELNVMKKVQHPNVIQLIEYDEEAEYPEADGSFTPCLLVVLEYAPGGELFDYLMYTGRFDETATRTYFHQFMAGLTAVHGQGIAHRDLKPENLLLDADFTLKIADFGFATEYMSTDGKQTVIPMTSRCGTKGYLAPELLKGKKYNQKCDIFAVGIIMFTTFAGFPPFQNAVESDWWWDKLSKGWKYYEQARKLEDQVQKQRHLDASKTKKDLFWKAHERSCAFPAAFKNLMERTLHPLPAFRFGLPEIATDPWYDGETYSKEELKHYFASRVAKVRKERVTKIEKQINETPAMVSRPIIVEKRQVFQDQADKLDPKNLFEEHCQFEDDVVFHTAYTFDTYDSPKVVAARIQHVAMLCQMKYTIAPEKNLILVRSKVVFNDEETDEELMQEMVTFAVKPIIAREEDQDDDAQVKYRVMFKRLQGSHQSYRRAVESILDHPAFAPSSCVFNINPH